MSQDFLKDMVLFKSLEDSELVEVLTLCLTKKYPLNSIIFSEEDPATKMYLVKQGEVRISKRFAGVGEEALAILKPGEFFGEMGLIDEAVRSADAIAHTECTLMEIPIQDMRDLLQQNRDIGYKVYWEFCKILSVRLRSTNAKFYGLFAMSGFFK